MTETEKAARHTFDFHIGKAEEFEGFYRDSIGQSQNTMDYFRIASETHREHAGAIANLCRELGYGKDWLK